MSDKNMYPIPVRANGEHGETIMVFRESDFGNLGVQIRDRILGRLLKDGVEEKEAERLAKIALEAAITAIADVFNHQEAAKVVLHTTENGKKSYQTFTVQRSTNEHANEVLRGERVQSDDERPISAKRRTRIEEAVLNFRKSVQSELNAEDDLPPQAGRNVARRIRRRRQHRPRRFGTDNEDC